MAVQGSTWMYKAIDGFTRLNMAVYGCMAVQGCMWLYKAVHGSTRLSMAVKGCTLLNTQCVDQLCF